MRKRNKSSPVNQIFNDPHRGAYKIRNSHGILAQLFRLLVVRLEINERDWNKYINDYLRRFARENPTRSKNAERGNTIKAFTRPTMSWRTFLRALVFSKMKNARLVLEGEAQDGTPIRIESQLIELADPLEPIAETDLGESDDTEDSPHYLIIPRD